MSLEHSPAREGEMPLTLSVPEAGKRYYDLGRNASYAAAANGVIPTIRVGRLLRVPVAAMQRKFDADADAAAQRAVQAA
jgi:hypothetical protein